MATQLQNLSNFDISTLPSSQQVSKQKYAIIVADWNPGITHVLKDGAYQTLIECGVIENNIHIINVPGTFELTYAAKECQRKNIYDAIITLGCVIQGDTPHFDYVCSGVTQGISILNTKKKACPVIFGVLTTLTLEQAQDRAGGKHGNKGVEAAVTAIKMANIF